MKCDPKEIARDWQAAASEQIALRGAPWVDRAVILEECGSTQDEAARLCEGRAGLILGAVRQTAGRGRLGRKWEQTGHCGLAITIVLDAAEHEASQVSLLAGFSVARACENHLATWNWFADDDLLPIFRIRWPNDIVVYSNPSEPGLGVKKVAGVLVEQRLCHGRSMLLVGIGINLTHAEEDFPKELRERATSLRLISEFEDDSHALDHEVMTERLIDSLLFDSPDAKWMRLHFQELDVLRGTQQVFIHDRKRYAGIVEGIDPTGEIVLRTGHETVVRLPALTTSLVHD